MLDIFAQFATDESLENNGTWFPIGADTEILVARVGNRAYSKMLSKEVERNRKALDLNDEAADNLSDSIMINVMAETLLLGWRTKINGEFKEVLGFKKKELAYNKENAKEVLSVKDFRKLVAEKAGDSEAYRVKLEEEQGEA